MTMIPFEAPKKPYHQHTYKDCVCNIPDVKKVGEKFLTIWSYCPECGKLRQRPSEKSWMIRTSNTIEWSDEAEREFNPKTRTLPYFDIDDEWQEYIKPKKHWDTAEKLRELAAQNPPVDIFDQLNPADIEENRLYVEERIKNGHRIIDANELIVKAKMNCEIMVSADGKHKDYGLTLSKLNKIIKEIRNEQEIYHRD